MGNSLPAQPPRPSCCTESARGRHIYQCDGCGVLCLDVKASPNQARFLFSEKRHVWLVGPQGEGKTFIGILGMLMHASQIPKSYHPITHEPIPAKWAFVRDTHVNIKRISVPAFKKNYPGIFTFHDDYHLAKANGLDIDMFGMDKADDLGKVQGGEYDGIWIEEPAPIIAQGPSGPMVNAGMTREVFQVCATRMRGGKSRKRLQVTMNPADRSHWTFYEREMNPEWERFTETVRIRPGENPYVTETDRSAVRAAYADRPDLYKRYVLGVESEIYPGIAITPEYNSDWHKAAFELKPILGAENFMFFDGGLNATCVLAQLTPSGRLHLLDCLSMDNGGMYQLIKTKLIPLLNTPRWKVARQFRITGDPSLVNREQSDSNYSARQVIETMLAAWLRNNAFEPGVADWDLRRESINTLLAANVGGLPKLLVNPRTTEGEPYNRIHAALAGGYCYKLVNGVVQRDKPDKNRHSHIGDAITHSTAYLFGIPQVADSSGADQYTQQRRAAGYSVGSSNGGGNG